VIQLRGIPGTPPDLSAAGRNATDLSQHACSFAPRCVLAEDVCREQDPPLAPLGAGRAACHVRARAAEASHVG
jgi:ABC-type dipeptide/oligopeptide/nickel transport system ATPase component